MISANRIAGNWPARASRTWCGFPIRCGNLEPALHATPGLTLVRVCREGEAWAIAAGLWIGGARPLVVIQNTGLFESGDSLRNALLRSRAAAVRFDRLSQLPDRREQGFCPAVHRIGASGLGPRPSARAAATTIYRSLAEHMQTCGQRAPGMALIAGGRG